MSQPEAVRPSLTPLALLTLHWPGSPAALPTPASQTWAPLWVCPWPSAPIYSVPFTLITLTATSWPGSFPSLICISDTLWVFSWNNRPSSTLRPVSCRGVLSTPALHLTCSVHVTIHSHHLRTSPVTSDLPPSSQVQSFASSFLIPFAVSPAHMSLSVTAATAPVTSYLGFCRSP